MAEPLEISNEEYRKMEGVSSSDLKQISKSPAHFKYFKENPQEDTPALLFGRAYHKFCLEPDTFKDEYVVAPLIDRRTKAGKEEYQRFIEQNINKTVITSETMDTLQNMQKVLYSTPNVFELIQGEHEKSFFWEDEATGIKCKCRPDSYGNFKGIDIIVDLKTCESAKTDDFIRHSIKYLYDVQASHYLQGMTANTGKDYTFVFIAQEKKAPYGVNILEASPQFIRSGQDTRRDLLQTYKECTKSGNWYGYMGNSYEINSLGLPAWLEKSMGYEEESEEN